MPKKGQTWTPEQRAKILAAKQKVAAAKGQILTQEQEAAPELPPRQRVQHETVKPRPQGSRWQMKAGRWDTDALDDTSGDANALNIPEDLHPEGITLQWVTHSVYGKEEPQRRAKFEQAGWLPVHPEDFDGRFDGMYAAKGAQGEIQRDGLVLMAKPSELVKKSRVREQRAARQQVQIKEQALYGGEIGAMGADHPSAKRFNHVNRSYEKMVIPEE
jgi:hypothetical protein